MQFPQPISPSAVAPSTPAPAPQVKQVMGQTLQALHAQAGPAVMQTIMAEPGLLQSITQGGAWGQGCYVSVGFAQQVSDP